MAIETKAFFDNDTATFSYIVSDQESAAIIDPVLNYDQYAGRITTKSADELILYLAKHKLKLEWILETHIHADHLTAAHYLREKLGVKIAISSGIKQVLNYWLPILNLKQQTSFDQLLEDNQLLALGESEIRVLHTPGHTPACASFLVGDAIFVGDMIFMPDIGTGRTDFPGGSAEVIYDSIQRIFALGDQRRVFCGHDYPPPTREPAYCSTLKLQRENNILINDTISRLEFIARRQARDQGKPVPKLLWPALQVNLNAGCYGHELKIPLNRI